MQVRKLRRLVASPLAPELASYHKGPIFTNGSLEYVYNKPTTLPLQNMLTGRGLPTLQQFNVTQGPQLTVIPALTTAPIWGAGVPAGSIQHQMLIDDPESD